MTDPQDISKYVIVGGGTAGWIAAAILARTYQHLPVTIELIESPDIPTIGVGEATIPSIMDLLEFLQIPADQFVMETNATFKLGIKFVDWLTKGEHYWHQFGHIGNKIDGKPFYQHWLKHQLIEPEFELTDFSPAVALAKQNKFFIPTPNQPSNLSTSSYALHFDAALVAQFLAKYCQNLGVVHTSAKVKEVNLDEKGQISALNLSNDKQIRGDFYVDCSGQKGLLINQTLRVGFIDWQHYLPVDRAIAVQTIKQEPLPPYTQAIAHEHGWRWQIPLQNRTGNGYVYCSDYCTDEMALQLLEQHAGSFINTPNYIRFRTGKRDKVWHKNCLAVGLSAGFLEPLESTSIYLIMRTMLNFVQSIPDKNLHSSTINEFNRRMDHEYECIRDFIVLHYCKTKRQDSPFWQMWQTLDIPTSLREKLTLFEQQGRLYEDKYDLFSDQSWYAVLEGMGVRPKRHDPLINASNFERIQKAFSHSVHGLNQSVAKAMTHDSFIHHLKKRVG